LFYKQKADRTPEEWNEIIEKHDRSYKERRKQEAARDELVGKPAPPRPESTWLHGPPLTWDALRGKVVLLHFWDHDCAPCHNDMPNLASSYKTAAEHGIVIIGVHLAGSAMADVEADAKRNELAYPILTDMSRPGEPGSWGMLSHQFRVTGIPHAFLVDQGGQIAAHGSASDLLSKAYDLVKPAK
jgi:thiol-disulfide isomerase/thioredoxin